MHLYSLRRIVLSVTLLSLLAGCSAYRTAVLPGAVGVRAEADSGEPVVVEGVSARVYLNSGDVLEGEVVSVDSESITIGRAGNYGLKEIVVPASEVEKVEVLGSSKATSLLGGTAGGLLAVGVLALVLISLVTVG